MSISMEFRTVSVNQNVLPFLENHSGSADCGRCLVDKMERTRPSLVCSAISQTDLCITWSGPDPLCSTIIPSWQVSLTDPGLPHSSHHHLQQCAFFVLFSFPQNSSTSFFTVWKGSQMLGRIPAVLLKPQPPAGRHSKFPRLSSTPLSQSQRKSHVLSHFHSLTFEVRSVQCKGWWYKALVYLDHCLSKSAVLSICQQLSHTLAATGSVIQRMDKFRMCFCCILIVSIRNVQNIFFSPLSKHSRDQRLVSGTRLFMVLA